MAKKLKLSFCIFPVLCHQENLTNRYTLKIYIKIKRIKPIQAYIMIIISLIIRHRYLCIFNNKFDYLYLFNRCDLSLLIYKSF